MGYANLRDNNRHEADAARIKELEAQLKKERESKKSESSKDESIRSHLNDTVTVEKTSKKLKKQLILSWVCIFLGVLTIPEPVVGGPLIGIGIFALVYTKIQIWWRHG